MSAFTLRVNVYLSYTSWNANKKCYEHVPEGVRLCRIMKATLGYGHYNNSTNSNNNNNNNNNN